MNNPFPQDIPDKGKYAEPQYYTQPVNQTNTLGLVGFCLSLASFLTCGLLAPVSGLLSLIGSFSKPRGFAIAGLVLSLVSTLAFGFMFYRIYTGAKVLATTLGSAIEMAAPTSSVDSFYEENERLPNEEEFLELLGTAGSIHERVRFEIVADSTGKMIHCGPDGAFGTADDIENEIDFEDFESFDFNSYDPEETVTTEDSQTEVRGLQ